MYDIRNVFCVGRNYRLHAQELGNDVPKSPFLFSKPTHAVVTAEGQPISLPTHQGEIHHEVELVIHIGKDYTPGSTVDHLVDIMALGIDFTLRDVQTELKEKGLPWLRAKGFLNSAVLTPFQSFPGFAECQRTDFVLQKNGLVVQKGNIRDMLFDLQTIIDFTATYFGLGQGDIIFTGTPSGVGPVSHGDALAMLWGNQVLGEFTVSMLR